MAETVTLPRRLLIAATLCLVQAGAHAQSLTDPTRPVLTTSGVDGGSMEGGAGPQLQSVLIARQPGGRHVAVIDGDTVRLGETYKGARVARITPNEVELVRGKDRQVLRLLSLEEPSPSVKRAGRLQ
jgi:MSHA biogenesis protein MshK